jgi:hypothetical protein
MMERRVGTSFKSSRPGLEYEDPWVKPYYNGKWSNDETGDKHTIRQRIHVGGVVHVDFDASWRLERLLGKYSLTLGVIHSYRLSVYVKRTIDEMRTRDRRTEWIDESLRAGRSWWKTVHPL